MVNEKGDLSSPIVLRDYVVYRIPPRLVRDRRNLGGPRGVRFGPRARGSLAQRLRAPKKMPPGARKAAPRGANSWRTPNQVGYPASVNTDARSGFSATAHQSLDIAPER